MKTLSRSWNSNIWLATGAGFLLLLLGGTASAHWSPPDANNNIYYNAGKVGIGTTNPSGKLSVFSSSIEALGIGYQGSNSNRLLFGAEFNGTTSAEANVGFIGYGPTAAGGAARSIAFGSYTGSAWNEIIRLQSGGSVGIGTTSPSQKLHLFSSSGNVYEQIESGGTGAAGLVFKRSGAYDWLAGQGAASARGL